jgi:hypothetical protein
MLESNLTSQMLPIGGIPGAAAYRLPLCAWALSGSMVNAGGSQNGGRNNQSGDIRFHGALI